MENISVELIPDKEFGGFTARIPDLPAYGEGETEDQAIADLKNAVKAYVDAFGISDAISKIQDSIFVRNLNINLEEFSSAKTT